ncbi:MAG: ComEC/Rec2 family competence protein [Patescibacteria group bacterium]|nr:ComEC/Rec2 family competence protein [Patescibacteria group bacterium]
MRRSKIILSVAISFICGIALANLISIPIFAIYCFIILNIAIISLFWHNRFLRITAICLCCFLFGIFRFELCNNAVKKIIDNDFQNKSSFTGIIVDEPSLKNSYQNLIVESSDISGKILVSASLYPLYNYGDKLKIDCKLKSTTQDDKWKKYFIKEKIYYSCYYPQIQVISKNNRGKFYAQLLKFKQKSRRIIKKNVSGQESQILSAMLLGYKKNIPTGLRDKFSQAGISHIIAISGAHIAIIIFIVMSLLINFGLWRKQSFYLTIILIWIFIILIGAPSSAARAGIMATIIMIGVNIGRINSAINILTLAAALMLLINPFLLFNDIGFQLSFLAVFGIIYLSPIFNLWLKKFSEFNGIKKILIITLSAQIATLPLSIYYFGKLPILSPLINLIIVPLLAIILFLGFAIILFGFIYLPVAKIIGIIEWLILNLLIKITYFFTSLPFSYLTIEKINFAWILISYIIIISGFIFINKKQKAETIFSDF